MSEQMIIALLAGMVPVLLTSGLTWLEQRGQEARRERVLRVAQRQIELLQLYLGAQTLASPPDQLDAVRTHVATETGRVFQDLTEDLNEIDSRMRRERGRNILQRMLLLYKMNTLGAKIMRALYLLALPIAIFWTIIVIDVTVKQQDSGLLVSLLAMLIVALPFAIPPLLLRWLATALDKESGPVGPAQ